MSFTWMLVYSTPVSWSMYTVMSRKFFLGIWLFYSKLDAGMPLSTPVSWSMYTVMSRKFFLGIWLFYSKLDAGMPLSECRVAIKWVPHHPMWKWQTHCQYIVYIPLVLCSGPIASRLKPCREDVCQTEHYPCAHCCSSILYIVGPIKLKVEC